VSAKILVFDLETAPILANVWGLWDQNISLDMIKQDWHLLSWSAKWLGASESKIMYMDQRKAKDITDDSKLLKGIWNLLDEADVVLTQNGKKFDQKKLFARFVLNGMRPPSGFKHIDTCEIARRHFGFTSNKLEYLTDKLCTKYKKLKHSEFAGFDLWKECMAGNLKAWKVMEKYNKSDVMSLEELYTKLAPWDASVNLSIYSEENVCSCGSSDFVKNGYSYTSVGKYQRFSCADCGSEVRNRENLFSKNKKQSLRVGTGRK